MRLHDGKPRVGSKNYLDSPHAYIYDVHENSDPQDQHFQDSQSLGSYINETNMAGIIHVDVGIYNKMVAGILFFTMVK